MPLDLAKYEKYKETPEEKTTSSGLDLSKYEKYKSPAVSAKEDTSLLGAAAAFGEHLAAQVPATAAAFAGAGAAMSAPPTVAAAAAASAIGTPLAGAAIELGAAVLGGLAAGWGGEKATKALTPESLEKELARSKEAHPTAAFGGEVSSNFLFMGVGQASKLLRGTLGALGAGQEAVRETTAGEKLDPTKIAIAGGVGAAGTKTTAIGGKIAPAFKESIKLADTVLKIKETVVTPPPAGAPKEAFKVEELKATARTQQKKDQAREILDVYPEVQAATSGTSAKTRKKLEKYMTDPEVMSHIKRIQDTEAAFKEGEVPAADIRKIQVENRKAELTEAVQRGASHEELSDKKASLDRALGNVYFPGASRAESQAWVEEMQTRQAEATNYAAQQEAKPQTIEKSVGDSRKLSILKDPIYKWDYRNKVNMNLIMQGVGKLLKAAPDEATQKALFAKAENPVYKNDPGVKLIQSLNKEVWEAAKKHGVVEEWVDNYFTHVYAKEGRSSSETMAAWQKTKLEVFGAKASGMGTKSKFADPRIFKTYADAFEKAGLTPATTNPAEIYQIYAKSMFEAANNKQFINEISEIDHPATGYKISVSSKSAPKGYETINHPQFIGKAVSPDAAPTLRSMYESPSNSTLMSGAHTISMVAKKGIFSLSAFHIKSLTEGFLGALRNPKQVLEIPSLMKEWREGKVGGGVADRIDLALKGGLEIGHQPIDVHADVLTGLVTDVSTGLDKLFPRLGNTVRLPAKAIEGLNKFLWETVHPALKLATWAANHERLVAKGIDPLKASEMASTFTNDVFGGLNWRRIAENTNSYLGHRIATEAASKSGQRMMQIGLLAPDWTVATVRSWEGAFRGIGTDKVSPHERAMYQRYLLQSALLYAGVADLLNQHFVGKHFWENEDKTMVDMGKDEEGHTRKLQLSKHFMETLHWFISPNQTALNKLGYVPSELFRQALNQDYLSASGAAPRITEKGEGLGADLGARTLHALKGITPITLQTAATKTVGEAVASAAGFPVYVSGGSPEQRAERKQLRMELKQKAMRKIYEQ